MLDTSAKRLLSWEREREREKRNPLKKIESLDGKKEREKNKERRKESKQKSLRGYS